MLLDNLKAEVDAAARIYEAVNMALVATKFKCVGSWLACKLEDGSTSHVVYDTRTDAINDLKPYEDLYLYVQIPLSGMTSRGALSYLRTCRKIASRSDVKLIDPESVVSPLIFKKGR